MRPSDRPVRPLRLGAVGAVALAWALLSGCAAQTAARTAAAPPPAVAPVTSTAPAAEVPAAGVPAAGAGAAELSPLAALVRPAGSALYDPAAAARPAPAPPVGVTIAALGIRDAPVLAVGVRDDGELEVPGAEDVGWYRYGPRPGDPGSAMLAAHVAFDGEDGVFRHLTRLASGELVEVRFADGTTRSFRVTGRDQHAKEALPSDVWAVDGPPRLALVTCGGTFDRSASSYRDNVVVYAEPV
jgi:hypothetical protein